MVSAQSGHDRTGRTEVSGAHRGCTTLHTKLPGDTCMGVRCKCRPAGWHKHAHLPLRQAPVSIDLAAPWRLVDGASRWVCMCRPG